MLANLHETDEALFETKREVHALHVDVMKDPSRLAAKQEKKGTFLKRVVNKK